MTPAANKKISVLIADDHPLTLKGLESVIEKDESLFITGKATNGKDAFDFIKCNNPDVAVIDIDMPVMNGIELVKELKKENITTKIALLTMHKDETYFNTAIELGVNAYVLKDSIADDLTDCIKTIYNNEHFFSPKIGSFLINRNKKLKEALKSLDLLTKTERDILKLLALNKTSKEIADELFNSVRTIETHRTNICSKLGLKGHNALLVYCMENKAMLLS